MADTAVLKSEPAFDQPLKPWQFKWLWGILAQPRATLRRVQAAEHAIWQLPLLLIVVLLIVQVLVNAPLKITQLEQQGGLPNNPNMEWMSPEQIAQLQQALEGTKGPVFQYVFPIAGAVLSAVLVWGITAALLHLFSTLQGGRGSMTRILNLVAWASVPIILQLVVQIVYVLATGKLIAEQGLGGFAPMTPDGSVAAHALLSRVTLYWLWEMVLLMVGVKLFTNINTRKAILAVVVTAIIVMGLRILPDVIGAQLGGLTVSQPFPFF